MNHNDNRKTLESYSKICKWYDEHRSRTLFEKNWLDTALNHLKAGKTVLDIGCGMGEPIAKYFIDKGFDLTGIDGCVELVEIARKRLPSGRFLVCDMRELSLGYTFDFLIAWNSFFHLSAHEQRKMFSIFSSHLNNGGLLLFTTGPDAGEVWSNNGGENLYHASLAPKEYKALLEEYAFELIDYKINDENCNDHTVWLARYK